MKKKNLLALLMALVFVLASAAPALAEEEELPPIPEQEEETIPLPEETLSPTAPDMDETSDEDPAPVPEPEPVPGEELPAVPTEPVESEDVPPASEIEDSQDPSPEELPGAGEGEFPDIPQAPEDGEAPGEGGELLEDEEIPDEEAPEEQEEPALDSGEEGPIINVLVPSDGQVIINPYRMKVDTSIGETTEQIVHEPQALVNFSDIPVQVDVWAVGMLAGDSDARFVAAPPAGDAVDKEIFMYLEFQQFPDWWNGAYGDFDNQLLVTSWGESKANVMTLLPGGEGWYRLSGSMTNFPSEMWQEEDAASVTVVFSFNPIPENFEIPASYDLPEQFETPEIYGFPEYFEAAENHDLPEYFVGPEIYGFSEPPEDIRMENAEEYQEWQ